MPIGVPKVPYRLLGENQIQWVDIYNRLSRERVLFLTQDMEEETTNQLIGLFLYLSSDDEKQDIFLYVNAMGGIVVCGLSLVDTIQYIKVDVNTINVGTAASRASFVVARGKKGKRLALPHARFIIHQPEGGSKGQATEIFTEAEEIIRLRQAIGQLYSEFTGKSLDQVALDLDREEFFGAKQACDYGLIDSVRVHT
nr:proteolytic subunit 2 of clp protease [Dinophyceae sp. MRD-151]|eukprot:gnl/MRDRNA2_/MRDRNA2_87194_c0_seq1.p3 gnl/MRDRNA2_/MRDRNA2_87194_c0~~gnl/MRDRNA2_/MRDRNA2_87194_c0_seq1.p3  ORF type:complete len:197 (+),score=9.90 gnl/MRDRNA2_/MRDRNA2_87194_c0_seq1:57-647(+)